MIISELSLKNCISIGERFIKSDDDLEKYIELEDRYNNCLKECKNLISEINANSLSEAIIQLENGSQYYNQLPLSEINFKTIITENRKKVGFAEVSLYIDNSDASLPVDYSEVVVTRRLFRNGDSSYLINGTECRLKDVQELFLDTGVGRDGYSLIGQGKIDEILSTKSEEKRAYWMLSLPAIIFYFGVMTFPSIFSVVLSLTNYSGGSLFEEGALKFVGFKNYMKIAVKTQKF